MDKSSSPSNSSDENNPLPDTSDKIPSLPENNPPFSENPVEKSTSSPEISAENASVFETSVDESSIAAETSKDDIPTFGSNDGSSSCSQVLGVVTNEHQNIPPEISAENASVFGTSVDESSIAAETSRDDIPTFGSNDGSSSCSQVLGVVTDENQNIPPEISAENASVFGTSVDESSIAAETSRDDIPPFDSTEESSSFSQVLGLVTNEQQNIPSENPEASDSNFSFPVIQENNPSFDSQSSKKPMENNLGFLMRVKPASILKKAVSSLSDETFNPEMCGMIEVGVLGFEITVHKKEGMDYDVFGFLSLKADRLDEFVCEKPMRCMVSLHGVNTILDSIDEKDDIVTVFHINGTDLLSFGFGTPVSDIAPGIPFALHIDLFGDDPQYPKFPDVSYRLVSVIKSKDFISMCEQALAHPVIKACNPVTLTMDTSVELIAENCNIIKTAAESQCVWIDWNYCWESLKKALKIRDDCDLCFVTDPNDRIMLRFELLGLGDFAFLINHVVFCFESSLHFTSLI